MAKKKNKQTGSMTGADFSGGTGNIETALKETPEEVRPFLNKAIKIEA